MMLVCVVFMVVNITRDMQYFQPPTVRPPLPEFEPVIPSYHPPPLYELPPIEQEETTAWLNGRPIQTYIPPDEEETPWNKQNNNVMTDTHTQKEAADVLAQTLGKKQLDPFPILGTNQPSNPVENLPLELEEPDESSSSSEDDEDTIPMMSSMQDDDE